MAKYLVDANVLSEATKERPASSVIEWLAEHETELAVNAIVLGELEYGILLLPSGRRRARLEKWFQQSMAHLEMLELDRDSARAWAELLARLKRKGASMPVKDSLIAASALQHDLTIATRNTTDFRFSAARLVNPFEA